MTEIVRRNPMHQVELTRAQKTSYPLLVNLLPKDFEQYYTAKPAKQTYCEWNPWCDYVTSVPTWRDTLRAETYKGYWPAGFQRTQWYLPQYLYKSCAIAVCNHPRPVLNKNYIRIVVSTFMLQRTFLLCKTISLRSSITIKLLPCTTPIERSYPI